MIWLRSPVLAHKRWIWVRNVIFLTWELVLWYWKPLVWSYIVRQRGYTLNVESADWIESDDSGVRTWSLHWLGSKVLSTTENFWVISGQREVNHATRRRDRFQPTTDDISRYFRRRTSATEAERIWIDGSHHQAYCISSLASRLHCRNKERLDVKLASHFTYKSDGKSLNY